MEDKPFKVSLGIWVLANRRAQVVIAISWVVLTAKQRERVEKQSCNHVVLDSYRAQVRCASLSTRRARSRTSAAHTVKSLCFLRLRNHGRGGVCVVSVDRLLCALAESAAENIYVLTINGCMNIILVESPRFLNLGSNERDPCVCDP